MTMPIKLILTDMDGTLLNNKKEIPEDTLEIIQECLNRGIIFGIASGRQMENITRYFKEIEDQLLFVAENGANAKYRNKNIFFSALDPKEVPEFIRVAREMKDGWPVLCTQECAYIDNTDARLVHECQKYYSHLEIVEDLLQVKEEACKIAICDLLGSENQAWPLFKGYQDQFQITVSADIWLDISNKNVSKGDTIASVQETFHIQKEETVVFADYLNDMTMLQQADHRIIMENAHPDLFPLATKIAPSNEVGGVILVLNQFLKGGESL